jgi:hypothetical protein
MQQVNLQVKILQDNFCMVDGIDVLINPDKNAVRRNSIANGRGMPRTAQGAVDINFVGPAVQMKEDLV